ncbi:MAG TPA: hypothetical protein VFW33_02515 [Gemmataceae bacterium]|nr:hypothetical protein [Gemmataceae bacterium]
MSTLPAAERTDTGRLILGSLAAGVVALAVCVIGAFFDPEQFFRAYLSSYLFYQGIGLGCLAILMIYYCTGGAWGFLIRRPLEAGTRTLPLLALLIIPIGAGLRYLFVWARPEEVAADKNLQWKQIYLNVPFWWGRAVLFFVVFLVLTWLLNAWSRRQEQTGDGRYAWRLTNLSGPGLVAFGVCMHFAAVDWLMSLQTAFKSSIIGPLLVSGQLATALATVIIVVAWLSPRPPLGDVVSLKALNDLGNLLLAFLVIWAYMSFFQFMLIWIANLPHEIIWYIDRSQGGWQWVITAVAIFHFGVPFFLLLQRAVKQTPVALAAVCGLVLFMHQVFLDWQVFPAFLHANSLAHHWMDFLMPVGLGGLWLAYYLWQLRGRPLVPRHDENRPHALLLRREDLEEAEREAVMTHG